MSHKRLEFTLPETPEILLLNSQTDQLVGLPKNLKILVCDLLIFLSFYVYQKDDWYYCKLNMTMIYRLKSKHVYNQAIQTLMQQPSSGISI